MRRAIEGAAGSATVCIPLLMAESDPSSREITSLREFMAEATRIVVLTGAGISAESGIPTFRGPGGLWRNYPPERLATPEAFARDPRLVWEWYDWRRGVIRKAEPNPGHLALAEFERRKLAGNTAQDPYAMGRSPGANNSAGSFTL